MSIGWIVLGYVALSVLAGIVFSFGASLGYRRGCSDSRRLTHRSRRFGPSRQCAASSSDPLAGRPETRGRRRRGVRMCHTIPAGRAVGRAVRHEPGPSPTSPPARRSRLLRQGAVATVLMLALATPSTIAYADMAAPGRPLWAARLQLESARLALESDPSDEAALHLEFAARRLSDLAVLLTRDADPQVVDRVAANLEHNLDGLHAAMEPRGEQAPPAPVEADLQQRLLERVVVVGELARSGCAAEQIGQEGCANLQQAVEHSEVILADVGGGTQVAGDIGSSNAASRRAQRRDGDTKGGGVVQQEPAATAPEGEPPPEEPAPQPLEQAGPGPAETPSDGATETTEPPGEAGEPGEADGAGAIGAGGDTGPITDVPPEPSPPEGSSPDPDPSADQVVAPPGLEPFDPEPEVSPGDLPAYPVPSDPGTTGPGPAAQSPTPSPSGGPNPSDGTTPTPAGPVPAIDPFPVVPSLGPIPQDPTDPPSETGPSETGPSETGPSHAPPSDPAPGTTPADPAPVDPTPGERKPSDPKPDDPKPSDPRPDDPGPDAPPPADIRSPEPEPEPEPSNAPPPRSEGRPKDEPSPQDPPPSELSATRLGRVAGGRPHE